MSSLLQDLRYGARQLRKSPGITAISILTLALGIGLTATMYSIVYGALIRGLPFEEPERIMLLHRTNPARGWDRMSVSLHDFHDWRAQQKSFDELGAFYTGTVNLSGSERPERFSGAFMTANGFRVLRVQPSLGRTFREGEDAPGAEPVVILGHDLWKNHFGSDPAIVGKTVRANGEVATVVGVMPERFAFPYDQSIWLPLRRDPGEEKRGAGIGLSVFGRLRDGATRDQAAAELAGIAQRLAREYPDSNEGLGAGVMHFADSAIGDEPRALLLTMLGAVMLVLLIACANVANLLLGQVALRTREVGIRSALGASRGRIVMQFLTEPLVLAAVGAVLGVGIAHLGVNLFNAAIADDSPPFWIQIRVDGPVLLFVVGITLLATFASGVLPALRASRTRVSEVLKDEARGSSSLRTGKLTRALVVFEIALSCGLLVGAGLTIKSIVKLQRIDFGFATQDVFTARVGLPETDYPDAASRLRFYEELQPRLAALPGARAVSLSSALPATGAPRGPVRVEGQTYAAERDYPLTGSVVVTPGFFGSLGAGVEQGRDFTAADRAGGLPVAIVNRSFAARHFGGQSPVGKRIRLGGADTEAPWLTVVGVAPDMYVGGVQNDEPEAVYRPLGQDSLRFMSIVVRARGNPMQLTPQVRDAVASVDPDLPIYFVNSLEGAIAKDTWFYRVFGSIFMILGFVALFLAAIGLYGVMSSSVAARTREMGVRMALGAQARDVVRLIVRQGVLQLAVGVVLGLGLAAGVSHFLSVILYEVEPRDPFIFAAIVGVLAGATLLASFVPAKRATRVDPMVALRYE